MQSKQAMLASNETENVTNGKQIKKTPTQPTKKKNQQRQTNASKT